MTDAQRIIGDCLEDEFGSTTDSKVEEIVRALTAAGFRILCPDEVDAVTLEKCAEIALSYVNQTDYDLEPEAAVAENVTAKMIAAALRALGRKA